MNEYFIVANSNAAPVVSDESTHHVKGRFPRSAMNKFIRAYKHWCGGPFGVNLYNNADDYHKGCTPVLSYRSRRAATKEQKENWEAVSFSKEKVGFMGTFASE